MASLANSNTFKSKEDREKFLDNMVEIQPEPYANTYLSRKNRKKLYSLDKEDPTKAKFQAHLRKSLMDFNDIMKINAQGSKWRRKSNKMKSKGNTPIRRSKTLSSIPRVLTNINSLNEKANKDKINKELDKSIAVMSNDEKLDGIFKMLSEMNKDMKELKEKVEKDEAIQPVIGPKQAKKMLSERFTEYAGSKAFEPYLKVIENLSDLIFGNFTKMATGQETSFMNDLKKLLSSNVKSIVHAIWSVIKNTFKVAYKLNIAAVSFIPIPGVGNFGGGMEYLFQAGADAILLFGSCMWIILQLNLLLSLAAAVSYFTGTTALVSYLSIAVSELSKFFWSFVLDATLLPIRSIIYIISFGKVGETGNFKTLVLENKKNTRLWYFVRFMLDTMAGYVNNFWQSLLNSSEALQYATTKIKGVYEYALFLQQQIGGWKKVVEEQAKAAAAAAAEAAAEGLRIIAENLNKVPQALSDGKDIIVGALDRFTNGLPLLSGVRGYLGTGNNAMAVCSILGITIVELKGMKNQPVVSYVLKNNSMNELETFLVLCELSKEVEQKEVLLLEDKPKLKF